MRTKLSLLALSLVLGTGLGLAAAPYTNSPAMDTIQSRLNHAQVFKHGDVKVMYEGGVATLTGTLDNLGSKLDAEKALRKVKGVKQVVDNIRVHADGVTDQQILEQARHEIVTYYANRLFGNVSVVAQNGTLAVTGQVAQAVEKVDMENLLERVRGVAELQNNLEVLDGMCGRPQPTCTNPFCCPNPK